MQSNLKSRLTADDPRQPNHALNRRRIAFPAITIRPGCRADVVAAISRLIACLDRIEGTDHDGGADEDACEFADHEGLARPRGSYPGDPDDAEPDEDREAETDLGADDEGEAEEGGSVDAEHPSTWVPHDQRRIMVWTGIGFVEQVIA